MDIRCATSSYVYSHTSNTRYIADLSFINPQPLFLSHHTRSTSPEVFVSRVNSSRYISLFVITRQALIHIRYRSFFKPTATSHKRKQDKEQVEGKDKEHEKPAVKRKKGFVEEEEEGEYEFIWSTEVDGLGIIENFVTPEEEQDICKEIEKDEFLPSEKYTGSRLCQLKGTVVDFKSDYVYWDKVIPLPEYTKNILEKFHKVKGLRTFNPNQQFNNIYKKNNGDHIYFHTDHRRMFGDIVVCISLLVDCAFQMKSIKDPKRPVVSFPFPKRAAVIMTRKARYEWKHGIPNDALKDDQRISITYRELKSDYRNKEMQGSILKYLVMLLLCVSVTIAACPHQTPGLLRWSAASTWPMGSVPVAGSNVVISGGRQVLLDLSPPPLASLTVQNGSLVWNNQTAIELRSGYVLVNDQGSFIIGSEECPFQFKATISLTGTVASPNVTGFGSKFLGVAPGGTLELHGKLNGPAWTRLSAKAYPPPASSRYHSGRGMNVVVFDQNTGAFLQMADFDTFFNTSNSESFATYIKAIATGRIVVMNIKDEAFLHLTENAYLACESVGSALIRQLKYRSGWAIIGTKGAVKGSVPEDIKIESERPTALLNRIFTAPHPIYPLYPTLSIYVQSMANYSFLLNSTYMGSPIITTIDSTIRDGWAPGTQIIVTTTDSRYDHTEVNTVVACSTCAPNQVKLANPFVYTHWGKVESGVEMRAEVASLTRNILVQGIMANADDSHGAHTKFLKGFKNVHIDGVEYTNVGQHHEVGHYPVHWHMAGDLDAVGGYASPTYLKNSAIHHSFARCFSIHGSHGVYVYNNVGYDIMGHCYFLEDGIETRNTLDHNLGALTQYGYLLLSDMSKTYCQSIGVDPDLCGGVSTFWITHPNNIITNNVAAGSVNKGIWYIFPLHPTGLSAPLGGAVFPRYTPMGVVSGNHAHSTPACFRLDDGIIYDPNNPLMDGGITSSRYKPHLGANLTAVRVNANINTLTTHHCAVGAWLRGGQITVNNYRSADNIIGLNFASEGGNPNDPGSYQTTNGAIFVGVSANSDWSPIYSFPIMGYQFYDGPHNKMNIVFKNFTSNGYHKVAAFGTELNNLWQISPTSNSSNIQFDEGSLRAYFGNGGHYYGNNDGMHNQVMHDLDGSLTRMGPGTWAVTAHPVHTINSCQYQPAWNASVCPATVRYGQLFLRNTNQTGTNYGCVMGDPNCKSGIILYRDDKSASPLPMIGIPNDPNPSIQFQPLVMLNKSYTVHFPHATPPNLQLQMTNWVVGEGLRVGICYPPSTNFSVVYANGGRVIRTLTPVNSLAALSASLNNTVYFYDTATNLLFVRPTSLVPRDGANYCSISGCELIIIKATGPNMGNLAYSGVCKNTYPKYATTDATTAVPPSTYST